MPTGFLFASQKFYISITLILLILSACAIPAASQASSKVFVTPTSTTVVQLTNTPALTPTEDLASQRQKISNEFVRELVDYNQLVEQEKLLGNIQTGHNSQTGQDTFTFTGASDKKIRAAYDKLMSQYNLLDKDYLVLYKQDYVPTPLPTFSSSEDALNFYSQSMQEQQDLIFAQLKSESSWKIYDPTLGDYESLFTFEQDASFNLRNEALQTLRLDAELSPELLTQHKTIVEKLAGEPIETSQVTSLPFYRNDLPFFQYQTAKNTYVLNKDSSVIEIIPNQIPTSDTSTPAAPLSTDQLAQKARAFINLVAPGTDLSALTPAGGSKIDNYFFRWEDRTKALLDDGRSYPFIQVALNQDGELLNYYNTLPLGR